MNLLHGGSNLRFQSIVQWNHSLEWLLPSLSIACFWNFSEEAITRKGCFGRGEKNSFLIIIVLQIIEFDLYTMKMLRSLWSLFWLFESKFYMYDSQHGGWNVISGSIEVLFQYMDRNFKNTQDDKDIKIIVASNLHHKGSSEASCSHRCLWW